MADVLNGQQTLPCCEGLPTRVIGPEPAPAPPRPRRRHSQTDLGLVVPRRGALDFRGQVLAAGRALAQARRRKLEASLLAEAEKRLRKLLVRARRQDK